MLFSYDCSLKPSFLFVWILLLSRTTSLQSWGRFYESPGMLIHSSGFNNHLSRWTLVSRFPLDPPPPLHTSSLTSFHHVLFRPEKGWQWRKRSGGKVHSMRGNWCRIFEAGHPSCCQPVLKTSFLQPPTDAWGKGRRCFLHRLSNVTMLQRTEAWSNLKYAGWVYWCLWPPVTMASISLST